MTMEIGIRAALREEWTAVGLEMALEREHEHTFSLLDFLDGCRRNVNIPWPTSGMGNADYLYAFTRIVIPIAYEFAPELVMSKG